MTDSDLRLRFLFPGSDIRGEIVRLENSLQPVLSARPYPLPVQGVLSEAMAAVTLMTGTLKFTGRLSLQAQGKGAVNLLLAEATDDGGLRGLAHHDDSFGNDPISEQPQLPSLIGQQGIMAITIRPQRGQQYQGVVPLQGTTLAACLEHYFAQSEQLPTRFWLTGGNGRAAGLMLQRLPDQLASSEHNQQLWQHLCTLADTVTFDELLGLPAVEVLHRLFHDTTTELATPQPLRFQCSCSRDKVSNTLRSLGRDELQAILDQQGAITVSCDFCASEELFDAVDLDQMIHQL